MNNIYQLKLQPVWMCASDIETLLKRTGSPLLQLQLKEIIIEFPPGCRLWLDAVTLLLAITNQSVHSGLTVTLVFKDNILSGYLNRIGFFRLLKPDVRVEPERPDNILAIKYKGTNINVVELKAILVGGSAEKDTTHKELVTVMEKLLQFDRRSEGLCNAAFLIFSELIQNIYHHSQTSIDGFAALQLYQHREHKIQVVVSDSGIGILKTVRPKANEDPNLRRMTDLQLLKYIFQKGFSKHGNHGGAGLLACAKKVFRYNGKLYLRLPTCSIWLAPSESKTDIHITRSQENLPLVWGTHFIFEFPLDNG